MGERLLRNEFGGVPTISINERLEDGPEIPAPVTWIKNEKL